MTRITMEGASDDQNDYSISNFEYRISGFQVSGVGVLAAVFGMRERRFRGLVSDSGFKASRSQDSGFKFS